MKTLLAFDTSGAVLTVLLEHQGRLFCRSAAYGLRHSEHLLPEIESLLQQAGCAKDELELIAVTKGPGSFTGLRIGMSAAKGLSYALGIPMVSVPTLEVYQLPFSWFAGTVMPVIDARKQRYYTAAYRHGRQCSEVMDCSAQKIADFAFSHAPVLFTGPDAAAFQLELEKRMIMPPVQSAFHIYSTSVPAEGFIETAGRWYAANGPDHSTSGPLYIRKSEAEQKAAAE